MQFSQAQLAVWIAFGVLTVLNAVMYVKASKKKN